MWFAGTHFIYGLAERRRRLKSLGRAWVAPIDAYVANCVDYTVAGIQGEVSSDAIRFARQHLGPVRRPAKKKTTKKRVANKPSRKKRAPSTSRKKNPAKRRARKS